MKKLASALLFLVVIFWCFNMAIGVKSAAIRANQKACLVYVSTIQLAIDLIDNDSIADIATGTSADKLLNQEFLVKKKCLRQLFTCPFAGAYKVREVSGERTVYCSFHGDQAGDIPGNLDPEYSLFYWFFKWLEGIFK